MNYSARFLVLARLIIPVALVAACSAAAATADDAKKQPAPGQPQHRAQSKIEYESRQYLGKGVTLARMSSGLTVIVRENHAAPVATVRAYVRNTGSVYEGKLLGAGVSHVLEHLVAGGTTKKRTEKEIQELIGSLGGRTNAFTSTALTGYYIDCPAKRAPLAIDLVADSLQHCQFKPEEYRRELGVVQRELEMGKADRSRVLYQAMAQLVYTEHPMRHPIIGYLSVLQQVSRDDIVWFYKNRYVPQNIVFVVVGDVKTDEILDEVLKHFANFHRTTERGPVLADEPDQASPRSTRIRMPGKTTQLSIAWPTVRLQHDDLYPLDVASYLLTNGDSSRLGRRLRIEQPLATGVDSASYTPSFVKGWFSISVECKPENTEQCRKIVLEEVARLKKELVSEAELAKVKRQKAAEHVFGQQTVQAQADSLGRSYIATGDPLFDDQYVAGIQKVTAQQVREVARKYFLPHKQNTVTIVPAESKSSGDKPKAAALAESEVIRRQLDNGLTVLLKRHTATPTVTIQAYVKAGVLSDPEDKAGRAALATTLMKRGTEKYSGRQIAEFFDSVGGSLGVSSQRNTSFMQCAVLKDDFEKAFDFAYQVMFKPTFPADEFTKVRTLQLAQIAARSANPQTEIIDFWTDQLPKESPYSRRVLGTASTVARLTRADCQNFHKTYVAPNNMVLAVYGDIDLDETMKLIEQTFGKEPKNEGFKFPEYPKQNPHHVAGAKRLANKQPNTAMVVMSYPTVSVYDEKTRAALDVFSGVLTGGGGMGGRLFNELRGARLVYYVFGFEMSGLAPGYYLFMAQTRPETAQEVIDRIKANIARLGKEGIEEKELARIKDRLIAAHALRNTTPASQAFKASLDELYGLGFKYDRRYDERIRAVTSADVKQLVKKFFQEPLVVSSAPEGAKTARRESRE